MCKSKTVDYKKQQQHHNETVTAGHHINHIKKNKTMHKRHEKKKKSTIQNQHQLAVTIHVYVSVEPDEFRNSGGQKDYFVFSVNVSEIIALS